MKRKCFNNYLVNLGPNLAAKIQKWKKSEENNHKDPKYNHFYGCDEKWADINYK